jgi:24-methylenesterol C-methyltransferase
MDRPHHATTRDYSEKYDRLSSASAAAVRQQALGSDVPNGYTSVDQAEHIAELLDLGAGERLLDLGAGRGWPGSYIAEHSGCDLVSSDLPLLAVRSTRETLDSAGLSRAAAMCADGRHLPFRDRSFDAVTHADVLC